MSQCFSSKCWRFLQRFSKQLLKNVGLVVYIYLDRGTSLHQVLKQGRGKSQFTSFWRVKIWCLQSLPCSAVPINSKCFPPCIINRDGVQVGATDRIAPINFQIDPIATFDFTYLNIQFTKQNKIRQFVTGLVTRSWFAPTNKRCAPEMCKSHELIWFISKL